MTPINVAQIPKVPEGTWYKAKTADQMASVTNIPSKAATAEPCGLRAVLLQLRFSNLVLPASMA